MRKQHIAPFPCPPVNLPGYKSPATSIYVTQRVTRGRSSTLGGGGKEEERVFTDSLAIPTCNLSINVCLGEKIASLFTLSIKRSVSISCYLRNLINYSVLQILFLLFKILHDPSSQRKNHRIQRVLQSAFNNGSFLILRNDSFSNVSVGAIYNVEWENYVRINWKDI